MVLLHISDSESSVPFRHIRDLSELEAGSHNTRGTISITKAGKKFRSAFETLAQITCLGFGRRVYVGTILVG